MTFFENNGIKIHYEIEGEGPDLIMIHGFSSNIEANWRVTNWISTLKDDNRLILIDCRGHGKSDKPTDPIHYGRNIPEDIIKLMDYLSIQKANFFGYSMGARLTFYTLVNHPNRVNCAILGGYILPPIQGKRPALPFDAIINGLKADNIDQVKDPLAKDFRRTAESKGANLNAFAAVLEGYKQDPEDLYASRSECKKILEKISVPVLTVLGSDDFLQGDKAAIANLVPNACHFQIQGKDHIAVVQDPKFKMIVKAFLKYVNSL